VPALRRVREGARPQHRAMANAGQIKYVAHMMSFLDANLNNDSSTRADQRGGVRRRRGQVPASTTPRCSRDNRPRRVPATPTPSSHEFAKTAGITGPALTTWQKCTTSGQHNQYVADVETASGKAGVTGTPTVKLNGKDITKTLTTPESLVAAVKAATQLIASIPSPGQSVWFIGPFPIRAYAMCILAGIVVAVWITQRRLNDRGGKARPGAGCGGVGGAVRHRRRPALPRDHRPGGILRPRQEPVNAFKIWEGGLGIWGAVALGTWGPGSAAAVTGSRLAGLRRRGWPPGSWLAQAIGRWGNYFNQELFGTKTSSCRGAWRSHCWDLSAGTATSCPGTTRSILDLPADVPV
jgi:hypothetical protein